MQELEQFKKRKWIFLGATAYPIYLEIFVKVTSQEYVRMYGLPNDVLALFESKNCDWFYDEEQLVAIAERMLPDYMEGGWPEYERGRLEADTFALAHEAFMNKDISTCSDLELQECARNYGQSFFNQFKYNNYNESLSYYFQLHLNNLLKKEGVKENDFDKLLDYYGRAKYQSYYKDCLTEYRRARKEEEKEAVIKKYYYFAYSYAGPVELTKEYLDELIQHEEHDESITPDIEISTNAQKILNVFQMISTLQDVRKKESLMMVAGTEKFMSEFSKRSGVPRELLMFALWSEMIDGATNKEELKKRKERCIIYSDISCLSVYGSGMEKEDLNTLRASLKGAVTDTKTIKGICASKGKVTGRAKIVLKLEEFDKVEKGDILFTVMTRPEYLPIMYKASAFVTDEGGIASHAAIVAREMKKPCIIATKIGTQFVKDGDMVEVDANTGTVRKI